jgi:hypothetical protein
MQIKEARWASMLLISITLYLAACQSTKTAKPQITDPNTVFAQGGAHEETGATPTQNGGRRNRGQNQTPGNGALNY